VSDVHARIPNPFAVSWVGKRYAEARPDFLGAVVEAIARYTGRVERALDLGCGTGLSTRALARVARRVIGLEPSAAMLAEARSGPAIRYLRARAEAVPLRGGAFDLVGVGCVWHWCERARLLEEVARVLAPGGWLAVWDADLLGREGSSAVLDWLRESYWARLPRCPRHPGFDPRDVAAPFALRAEERFEQSVPMTCAALAAFVTSQASTVHAIESGAATRGELETRLARGLAPFFPERGAVPVRFGGPLWLLRRE
jgi:SAM-dependent methyltransferase